MDVHLTHDSTEPIGADLAAAAGEDDDELVEVVGEALDAGAAWVAAVDLYPKGDYLSSLRAHESELVARAMVIPAQTMRGILAKAQLVAHAWNDEMEATQEPGTDDRLLWDFMRELSRLARMRADVPIRKVVVAGVP